MPTFEKIILHLYFPRKLHPLKLVLKITFVMMISRINFKNFKSRLKNKPLLESELYNKTESREDRSETDSFKKTESIYYKIYFYFNYVPIYHIYQIKSILPTQVNTSQHESTRVNTSPIRINTSQHEYDTSQHESTLVEKCPR